MTAGAEKRETERFVHIVTQWNGMLVKREGLYKLFGKGSGDWGFLYTLLCRYG